MTTLLDDGDVAAIQLRAPEPSSWLVGADGPETAKVVREFLESTMARDLKYFANGLLKCSAGHGEAHGFIYLPHEDFLDMPVASPRVRIGVFTDHVFITIPAFEALMLRFLRTVIASLNKEKNDVLKEEWWPNVLAAANALEQRAR